eukprot:CAMPEP_0172519090 /NCGR_PEP_ID=MMETSP1066-20121228/291209_1 /TAXON_ID=671091 /ORGANISM="Coscinodiscus wailesii, Strain CCMP2513" /LENGTH=346 /DNA_ID=CAMNT_0013301607 /DNA_START=84 /DNA_END=1121 /DNA_ORIENTATION=+
MINASDQIPRRTTGVRSNLGNIEVEVSLSDVISIAQKRWFKVSEMEYLLNPKTTPLQISTHTLRGPPKSGTVLLFNRSVTRNYKIDGHRWVKKRNMMEVREDHVKLLSQGRNRVGGFYAHSEDIETLHRRSYNLLDIDSGSTASPPDQRGESISLVLVHYLDTANVSKCVVGPGSFVRNKGKRTEVQDPGVSRVKDEAGEVYIGSASSVVNTLFEEYRLLNRWQNQLLSTRHLKLFSKSGFEGSLSPLWLVERLLKQSKQACPEYCFSNDVLSWQQNFGTQVQDVFDDDDILETLQDLCEDGVEESGAKVDCSTVNFVSNGKCVQDKNSSIVQPNRTFEADFDILW